MKQILVWISALLMSTANAANYIVTTTEDVFDFDNCFSVTADGGADSLLSLREAVCLANINKGEDTIVLTTGMYELNLGQIGGEDNISGDLDVIDSLIIQGVDAESTVIKNGFGDHAIVGDGDRLIDFVVSDNSSFNLTISNISLSDADLSCIGEYCISGGAVVNFRGNGTLSINDAIITNNQNSCLGLDCGDISNAAVFSFANGGVLNILDSSINNNRTNCEIGQPGIMGNEILKCTAGNVVLHAIGGSLPVLVGSKPGGLTTFTLTTENTQIEDNDSSCTGCDMTDLISLEQPLEAAFFNFNNTSISNNNLSCSGEECSVGSLLHSDSAFAEVSANQLKVNENILSCDGRFCNTDYLFRVNSEALATKGEPSGYGGFVRIENSQFNNNVITCTGEECNTDELLRIDESGESSLISSEIKNNQQTCIGIDCGTDELIEMCCSVTTQIISDVVISNNIHHCNGRQCDTDEILDVGTNSIGGSVQIENTSVVDNTVSCTGLECACDVAGINFRASGGVNTINQVTIAHNTTLGDENISCGNRATAGIRNDADNLLVTNTTIHGNKTVGSGGGILNSGGLILDHVTITDNEADIDNDGVGFGSGICNAFVFEGNNSCGASESGGTVQLSNTILNNTNTQAPDCYGLLDSIGFNLINNDSNCSISGDFILAAAELLPLADNGCTTPLADGSCVYTQLASDSSAVIDAGSCFSGQNIDQRGFNRPFDLTAVPNADDGCDIGATETSSDLIFRNGFE